MRNRGGRILYKKVLLAYDGSIEGRLALREGAKLAQFCGAEVFLLAVVEPSFGATLEGGVMIPMDEQIAIYKSILAEGVERLRAMGFSPTARLGMGAAGQEIAGGRRRDRSKPGSGIFGPRTNWEKVLSVNLWGVINFWICITLSPDAKVHARNHLLGIAHQFPPIVEELRREG